MSWAGRAPLLAVAVLVVLAVGGVALRRSGAALPREAPIAAPAPSHDQHPEEEAAPASRNRPAPVGSAPAPAAVDPEFVLMARLRSARHPADVIALAQEGSRRFHGSPSDDERASLLVHALASEGRASEARGVAEAMVNQAPDSPWVREVEAFTGAHRHRNLRLGADGNLEAY